tara:strand:+ start:369 stop:1055 length:687 start_codon:yes stop_codon:yes gene_type:complete
MNVKKNYICIIIIILLLLYHIIIVNPISIQYDLNVINTGKRKVFCIGLGRTATSSLTYALIKLGYKTWHCPYLYDSDNIRNYVNKFDALTELPFCCDYNFKQLCMMYPDAQFILTVRDEEKWLKSTDKYKWLVNTLANKCPGYELFCRNFNNYDFTIENYKSYNEQVVNFFKEQNKEDQLLIMNIPEGDGYDKLCKFLNVKYNSSLGKFPNVKEINLQMYLRFKYFFH